MSRINFNLKFFNSLTAACSSKVNFGKIYFLSTIFLWKLVGIKLASQK